MPRQDYNYRNMVAPILDFLRAHSGRSFTVEEMCQQFGCTPMQARIALNVLVQAGLVRKERLADGSDRYIWGTS